MDDLGTMLKHQKGDGGKYPNQICAMKSHTRKDDMKRSQVVSHRGLF